MLIFVDFSVLHKLLRSSVPGSEKFGAGEAVCGSENLARGFSELWPALLRSLVFLLSPIPPGRVVVVLVGLPVSGRGLAWAWSVLLVVSRLSCCQFAMVAGGGGAAWLRVLIIVRFVFDIDCSHFSSVM